MGDSVLHVEYFVKKENTTLTSGILDVLQSGHNHSSDKLSTVSSTPTITVGIKASGTITVQIYAWFDLGHRGGNKGYFGECIGKILVKLDSYSFNTTADVPLASGNAFFLCTDQHNSPYTISDSQ